MHLNALALESYHIAREQGLHDNLNPLPLREQTMIRLALIHTEVSEATQVVKRRGIDPASSDAMGEELADIIIRTAELSHHLGMDLDAMVAAKMQKNRERPRYFGTPWEGKACSGRRTGASL